MCVTVISKKTRETTLVLSANEYAEQARQEREQARLQQKQARQEREQQFAQQGGSLYTTSRYMSFEWGLKKRSVKETNHRRHSQKSKFRRARFEKRRLLALAAAGLDVYL